METVSFNDVLLSFERLPSAFDEMTNGEVIQAVFPNLNFTNVLSKMYAQNGKMLLEWWNAPYRTEKGGEEK